MSSNRLATQPWPFAIAVASLLSVCVWGCDAGRHRTAESIKGQTMGTTFSIKFVPTSATPDLTEVGSAIDQELDRVNMQMSTYQDDSEISQFNASTSTDWFPVSGETAQVVHQALDIHKLSDGAFDVTVGPLVNLWGFGPSPEPEQMPSELTIEQTLAVVGSDKLSVQLEPPAIRKSVAQLQIDLSAIAKGHGVDRVAECLERFGVGNYFVEIGGEIRTKGHRIDGQDWQVGIEKPDSNSRSLHQVVGLSNNAMATSGDYRNFLDIENTRVSHFIDPKTGRPVASELVSATVVQSDCATADAIATALMSAGLDKALQLRNQYKWPTLLIARRNGQLETFSSREFERLVSAPESPASK